MGFIKPNNNSGGSGGGLTPQELSRLNNAYTHSKSEHAPTTAEQNVQPDWNETDTTSDAYIKNKPDLSQIGSGGNIPSVTQIEPQELDMPKVFFYGNALPTTKDNVNLTMDYISNTAKFSSFVKLKCQGTSSMSYAKKNFTVTMFSDEARATKLKKDFKGWGAQSKFCLKANYVDTTHTRNLSGARIAYDMVASRPDSEFKQQLLQCPRNGLVDGFPIKLYFNGEFYGIYTWNIPKDAWMFNMDKSNPNHVVLCAERNTDGNANAINSCQFRQLWTNGDGQDWSVEVGTMSEDLRTKFNRVIAFVMNATDQEFHDNISEYFDLYSLLDYYCFSYLTCHLDGLAKNMLMVTYDGVHWGASLYDMDSIYGVSWNGASYVATNYQCPEQYQEQFSRLWQRIERCFGAELYARYLELRQGALSLSNIVKHVEEIYDVIPDRVFADEKAKWTSLPNVNTNTMTRFRNYMRDRAVYVDAQMLEIGTPQSSVECTGITLDKDTLTLGVVEGGTTDDSNKNYLENVTWELGTLNGNTTSYSLTDSTTDYRCQLTNLPVGTYTLHHDTYTYKKVGLNDNGIALVGTSAKGAPNSSDITFNITNPNTTVDISVFPNGVTPSGVTLTRADISDVQEYAFDYNNAGSPSWANSIDNNYLVVELAVGGKTNVDRDKLVNICIGDDKYYISKTASNTSRSIATLSNKCLSSEYANVIYVCIALPKSKYGNTLDEFKAYCSNNGISNIYINKDIQSARAVDSTTSDLGTNLLDGAEWLDGQLNAANGVILTGTDKYTKININTPGKYTLSSTMGYTYKKVIMYSIDDIFMYSIGDSNDTNDITLNILEPCIIRISAYPNNLEWDSTTLSFIGENFDEVITNKDVTYTLTASDINVRYIGSQYVFTELFLNKVYNDITIVKYDGNNYKLLYKFTMAGNDTNIQTLINMNNLGYTYYGSWNNKSFLYTVLPIAYGTTADEILSNMTSTTITINSTDELAKLESTGGTTSEILSAQLTATVTPENCTQPVVWSVSPEGIVTVDNGLVTAVANGGATVTATCGTQSATCAVTVSGISESGGGNTNNYITDSLYAYYDLTQLSTEATTVEDLSGNNNTFTVTRGTLSKDNLGGLIYTKDSNVLINSNSFNPQTAEASIEYTFKYTGIDNCNQPNNYSNKNCGINGDNGQGYYSWIGGFGYCIFKGNTSIAQDIALPNTLVNGEYYHIVCTISDNEAKYYLNGELLGTYSHAITGIPNNTTYYLGATSSVQQCSNQVLYSSRFYNKVLSQDEVTQNYTYEFTKLGLISGGDSGENANLVFQVNSTSMNTADNTLTDSVAGISATLTGNPTVSGNQIAFTASDTFSFDISSLNLTNSNRTVRIKFTPTTLDNNTRNVIGVGINGSNWDSMTSAYITNSKLLLQHGSNGFASNTVGGSSGGNNYNRLPASPVTGQEYELVISENINGNVRWFVNGTLVQNGTTTLFDLLCLSNTESPNRFIGSYSLIEIYNGYCNDYTEFTNMINNA